MFKKDCGIVRDLLPLVIDGVASPESNALTEAHLRDCPECAAAEKALREGVKAEEPLSAEDAANENERFLRFRRLSRKTLSRRKLFGTLGICALVLALLAAGGLFCWSKMYRESISFRPEVYSIAFDEYGFMQLGWELPDRRGAYGYQVSAVSDGVYLISPQISAWTRIFERREPETSDGVSLMINSSKTVVLAAGTKHMRDPGFRMIDGVLCFVNYEYLFEGADETGKPLQLFPIKHSTPIKELRLGTEEDYSVAYSANEFSGQ